MLGLTVMEKNDVEPDSGVVRRKIMLSLTVMEKNDVEPDVVW